MGQEKQTHGAGETDGTGETWVRRNVVQEKRGTEEMSDRRITGQEKQDTGCRRNMGQDNVGQKKRMTEKKNMGLEKRRTGKTYGTGETWNTCERGCTTILEKVQDR